ncbi:MAG: hypothetical protein ACI4EX_14320 [Lachnospiraceae bacterium]
MYKKQMKFQKIICYLTLIASAVVFIYSLGLVTDLYDSLYVMIPDPTDLESSYVAGAGIFYDIQEFNQGLTKAGIALILFAVFMLIMQTHTRRKYYVGNYVAIALMTVASVGSSVWALTNIMAYRQQYLTTIDFESLKMWSEVWGITYIESTFWFDLSIVVFGFLLLSTVLLVVNLIWKIMMTKEENRLILEGKEAA